MWPALRVRNAERAPRPISANFFHDANETKRLLVVMRVPRFAPRFAPRGSGLLPEAEGPDAARRDGLMDETLTVQTRRLTPAICLLRHRRAAHLIPLGKHLCT